MPSSSMTMPIYVTSWWVVVGGWSALMGVLLARAAGWLLAGVVFAGGGEALVGAAGHLSGALLLGVVGRPVLAGLDAGLDATADDRVGAVLGGLLVLLKPPGGHPGAEQLDLLAATDPAPLLGRRGAHGPGECLVELEERTSLLRGGPSGRHRRGPLVCCAVVPAAGSCVLVEADGAAAAGAALLLELPLAGAGDARPGAGQVEADPGLGDDLDQAGAAAGGVLAQGLQQS